MSVTRDDVLHVAALARLAVPEARVAALAAELNGILEHMRVLEEVDVGRADPATGIGAGGTPLRPDKGPPLGLDRSRELLMPTIRSGYYVVPRLTTHEDPIAETGE